jgi:hypothetical protein
MDDFSSVINEIGGELLHVIAKGVQVEASNLFMDHFHT